MRVFAKKAFEFKAYEEKDGQQVVANTVTTSPLSFCDLPEWVRQDPMFGWARQDSDIEIIANRADEKAAELSTSKKGNRTSSKSLLSIDGLAGIDG